MDIVVGGRKLRARDLSSHFNHNIIEINPLRIKYTNPREGVFNVMWIR